MRLSEGRVLGQDDRKWRAVVRRGKLIFGSLSSVPGERYLMQLGPQILLAAGGQLLDPA